MHLESGQAVKLKNFQDRLNPYNHFIYSGINYSLLVTEDQQRSLILGYDCGQIMILSEPPLKKPDDDDDPPDKTSPQFPVMI